ncbi:MAG: DOMON-like domain-containing protein [Gammaproteobacteria bacterium]
MPCAAVDRVTVGVRSGPEGTLRLCYSLEGEVARLRIPLPETPRRTDGLWQHTCFEAFAMAEGVPGYYEFNFSPSSQWAGYRFHGYRAGGVAIEPAPPPAIAVAARDSGRIRLDVALSLEGLLELRQAARLRLALAAVIEEKNGLLSYWALTHPAPRPDFHHADAFAVVFERSGVLEDWYHRL